MLAEIHAFVDLLAKGLELAGVAIIIVGAALAGVQYFRAGVGTRDWRAAYEQCRSNLGTQHPARAGTAGGRGTSSRRSRRH